jgi:hypothetical protein
LPLRPLTLKTGSANSALARIETVATTMHKVLTIQRPTREWVLAPKKSPRLRVRRAARVGGNWRCGANAAERPRAAEHSGAASRRMDWSDRRMESSCPTNIETVFMSDSLVHATPSRGCGLRAENAEYSRFRTIQRRNGQPRRQTGTVAVCAIRSLGPRGTARQRSARGAVGTRHTERR